MQIIKRSWKILWSYRALWVFGILLALTSGGGTSPGSNSGYRMNSGDQKSTFTLPPEVSQQFESLGKIFSGGTIQMPDQAVTNTIIAVGIGLFCLILILTVISNIIRYVSQTSLIRMVDGLEASGEKVNWRQGFRLGWSRAAWKLFLIDLLIFIPLAFVFGLLFACALTPILISLGANNQPSVPGIVAFVGLLFLMIFLGILPGVALALVRNFMQRTCVLQGLGARESIRKGWHLVRAHLKDVFLMWLILLGVQIGYSIAVIPVVIALLGVGLLAGGAVGLALYTASQIWIAIAIGIFILILVMAPPLIFLGGLKDTFLSTSWTLAYREAVAAEGPKAEVLAEAPAAPAA